MTCSFYEVLVSFRRNNTTIQIWARTPGCAAALTRTMYHVRYKSIPMNGGGMRASREIQFTQELFLILKGRVLEQRKSQGNK
jgi:hypothetical protein